MTKTRFSKNYLPILLAVIMVFEILIPCLPALAANGYVYEGGAGTVVSDLDTSTKYSESLGDNASTEYSGRIWTDKSVYTDDVVFATWGGGEAEIKLNENKNGEDFLVAYSALATSESVEGQTQAPVDVVFVIDISGSMSNSDSGMDNGYSRIYNTVQAVNTSITELMALNEYTRVGVVAFSSTYIQLLSLDRYTRVDANTPFFSLNRSTASNNATYLYTNAKNSNNNNITRTTQVSGGTNIQMGLYGGMNMLATETDTTANINGQEITRVPSVILLSDGAPTYSSDSSSWWAPSNNDDDGPGSSPYYGNGFKALITGAYMKDRIDANYKVSGNFSTKLYTIGMGITDLENYEGWGYNRYYTGEKDLALFTLNPGGNWTSTNTMATDMKNAWTAYTNQTPNGTQSIRVTTNNNETYTVSHPISPLSDIYTTTDKDAISGLVDSYYGADNASSVTTVFKEIVSSISVSAPQVPTEIKSEEDPTTGGKIIYKDPIGEYMEVKDVKAIIYAGHKYTAKTSSTSNGVTTYVFAGTIDSAVYGHQELDDIVIKVTEENGKQTLVVEIPASVIPLRVNSVTLNADGTVKTHTNNGAFPTRVIYSVGLKSDVVKKSDDGVVYINKSKISQSYLDANTNADGTINFYSNLYTNMHLINGYTVGDTMVEFEPSHTNKFYYILEDTPIYKDEQFTTQVSASEGLNSGTTYYYKETHYHGASVEVEAVGRTGAQLMRTEIKNVGGYLYRAEGSPRLNRILLFEGTKSYNNTHTAEDFYAPEFHYAAGSTSAYDGKFIVHLGNNGLLTAVAGGDLKITKKVEADTGLTAPDKSFVFTINLNGSEVNQGEYDYVVVDANGQQVTTGTVSQSSPTLSLKDGEVATIYALPPGTTYTVTEQSEPGFSQMIVGESGTIHAGQTSVVAFTNSYDAIPVDYPTNGTLTGKKVLEGRPWGANDEFVFFIDPYNNAPLPFGYNEANGISVTGPDVAGGKEATFDLGTIQFTAPGVYRYTIYEKEPENNEYLPGMSYSRALYRLVVTVVDNGNGTLSVVDEELQRLYDDHATALFTYNSNNQIVMNPGEEAEETEIKFVNTYSVDDIVSVPVAMKDYTDNSGEKPLVSGMFEFELKAIGIVENGQIIDTDVSKVPMPAGSVNGVIVTGNEGHNITFPSVTFTQQMLINLGVTLITYRYQMREVIPAVKVNGMTYDDTVYTIDVTVSIDGSSVLNVNAVYPNGLRIVTFRNTYTPTPAAVDISGTKTFNGRDMALGESFGFVLETEDTTGNVVIPNASKNATVTGAKDGVVKAFSFNDIKFTKAGTYVFKVSETAGSNPAITYDDKVVTVTVVVEDTGDNGTLDVVSVTYSDGGNTADFVNTYSSAYTGTPITVEATKNLTGKSLLAGEFYFDVIEYYNGVQTGERYVTHTVDTLPGANEVYSGKIKVLDNVTYTKPGTYTYVIKEQIPVNPVHGTTYDNTQYRVTVVVTDNNSGKLSAVVTNSEIFENNAWTALNSSIVFNNYYDPADAEAVLPLINKVIDGDRNGALKAGEFEFELGIVSAEHADGIILPTTTVVPNAANGNIVFDAIKFTKPGRYVVSVKEIVPADPDKVAGITYSTQEIVAVYDVTDNRVGQLTATLTQFVGGEHIINVYKADPAEVKLDINKTFTGRKDNEWLTTDKFDFIVKVTDAATLTAIENGDVEFAFDSNSTDTKTYTIATKGSKATADIKVNKAGTYKFTVSENNGGIAGVTYDTTAKDVVIIATDDSVNAKIKTNINGQDTDTLALDFTNTYKSAESAPIEIKGEKKVTSTTGNQYTLKGGEFTFVITGSANAPMPQNTSVKNAANGTIDFGTVKFTERGVYTYTVRESQTAGAPTGFTYDGSVYTVTVTVTDDYANAKLVTAVKIEDQNNNEEPIVFTNTYDPSSTSVVIFGGKTLDSEHKTLAKDEFSFNIKAVTTGAPMPSDDTVENDATGLFQFGAITYTKAGEYKYEITEKNLGKNGYTYDDTVYTVVVTVTDNNGSGVLTASVDLGTTNDPKIEFVNKYAPKPVKATIGAQGELHKTIDGRELNPEEFIFAVIDGSGKEIATAKNDKNGLFKFEIEFTKAGTYNYKIVERGNSVPGVTYDVRSYDVEIKIVDTMGILKVDQVKYFIGGNSVNEVEFNNKYDTADANVTVNAIKKLTGRQLKDGEFKFVLMDSNKKIISTATNTKDGKIVFDKIVITEAGTYTYTVYEENGDAKYVTYDKTEFVVEFKVTDNGKGELVVSSPVIKKADGSAAAEIVFENKYAAPTDPNTPQTGNKTQLVLWLTLLILSGAGFVVATVNSRKKEEAQAE